MPLIKTVMERKKLAGEKATEYIRDGMILGLGSGSTASYMINKVGELVRDGLRIKAVPTSRHTEILMRELNIPLVSIDEISHIDLAIDGVDEIDHRFNAIKGGGGALFREKIVAGMAESVIWIMDASKMVDQLGAFPLPVEVLPFGYTHVITKLNEFSFNPALRKADGKPYVTDNGNYIVDLHIGSPMDIPDVAGILNATVGVLETGLFLNMCDRMVVGTNEGVMTITNQ